MSWLIWQTLRRAPHRALLAALAVAFPVATLAATLFYVNDSVQTMTRVALQPIQIEMRALATSLNVDIKEVREQLRTVEGVRAVDLFGAADVVLTSPGTPGRVTARLFAVEPAYLQHHPWIRAAGDLRRGILLNDAVTAAPGFANAATLRIDLAGDAPPLKLEVPVGGKVDLREATTWFAIPAGEIQGDVAAVHRSILMDYRTFERKVLPALQDALGGASDVIDPGLSELPPGTIEAHVSVAHSAYPPDPSRAVLWSGALRRTLERRAPGTILVADNAAEPLAEAGVDATNAKILFFLLGIPGALVAGALGLAAASALAEAHRREDALLRLRGAADTQLVRLAVGQGLLAGFVGVVLGLGAAAAAVQAVIGHPVWRDARRSSLALTVAAAIAAGAIVMAVRLIPLVRAGRRSALAVERRWLAAARLPLWHRAKLDLVALVAGLGILGVDNLTGGLKVIPADGQLLALSFYVLLAPLALWTGTVLLVTRLLMALLSRWSRPSRPRPLPSWRRGTLRWLGRRPQRTAVALVLGALAVAFGTQAAAFAATYRTATRADAAAAFGSDLRVIPDTERVQPPPRFAAPVTASTPVRLVPAKAGSDRKTILTLEPGSYGPAVRGGPTIVAGGGLDTLAHDRNGVLLSQEIAQDFDVRPGDTFPVTVFPDDIDLSQKLALHVTGIYSAFPPSEPPTEMVMTTAALPPPIPPPDFYLATVAAGVDPEAVAATLSQTRQLGEYSTITIAGLLRQHQRSLTALNLDGLSRIEEASAALIGAVGVGVLGAFLVIERRREFAILRMVGADTRRQLTGPLIEGTIAVAGSLVIGIPVGLGLGVLAVRVLSLFFTLPPPLLTLPVTGMITVAALMLAMSAIALGPVLARIGRIEAAPLLREP
ncbi:ABC transporter permease [Streptosporangiaceae bacterium NEAU-GS5]|nr:ABC transporter permease [Streptosporangiaceae bacterium NEAU-GS5]